MIKRLKFLIKKIRTCNYKNAYNKAKFIGKKVGKSPWFILIDMLYCSIRYGAGYSDYVEFEYELMNNKQRKTYITSELNNRIVKKYNNKQYWYKLEDKITFNNLFKEFVNRDFISLRDGDATYEEFEQFCRKHKKIIIKPTDACSGEGIELIEINKKINLKSLYSRLRIEKKYLVEEFIIQHKKISNIYPNSVNTLRVISFLKDNNEVVILKLVMKFGNDSFMDNFATGGMYTFPNINGIIEYPAFDKDCNIYDNHPKTNSKIKGFQIPYIRETIKMIKKSALIVPEIRYVGWDVAITDNGPILIEGNHYCGLFQLKASLNENKIGDLPNFKKHINF